MDLTRLGFGSGLLRLARTTRLQSTTLCLRLRLKAVMSLSELRQLVRSVPRSVSKNLFVRHLLLEKAS